MSSIARNRPGRPSILQALSSRRLPQGLPQGRLALLGMLALTGCSTVNNVLGSVAGGSGPTEGQLGYVQGFLGGAVADEPRAALVARDVLSTGGTAVDAAVAAGFTLAVTLPSRTGLGGGGACLVYTHARNQTEAVLFQGPASVASGPRADRPAAVPMLARGLFALHTRAGRRPFEELVVPAEQLARFGTSTSRALAQDIAGVAGPLLADPAARAVFAPAGTPLREGETLLQPDLATTLASLRTAGVGDLHQGALARRVEQLSAQAGGPIRVEDLRAALPSFAPPIQMTVGNDLLSFLPPPADGGLAAAVAFKALQGNASLQAAGQQGLAAAMAWRQGGRDAAALLANPPQASAGLPVLPASASLVTLDRDGNAVTCAFSLNNLFGTGRVVPQLGFVLAAAPARGRVEPPLLSAVLAHNVSLKAFRYAGAGTGQAEAPVAAALPAARHLLGREPVAAAVAAVPEPGRANAIGCTAYMPGRADQCTAAADPRSAGLAVAGQQ
ncbi:gamma-glutamyltransferase [Teichococcus deserti]|nr:gamma-glutamyltransferase [Pseudoroseomonas deserti]